MAWIRGFHESPSTRKCSKHMRAVLNSFPVLWSIWNTPQYTLPPPLPQCWPSHCVLPASGTVSSSHHSITSSVAPTGDLSTHSGPWTFICLSLSKGFRPVPFNAPSLCLPSSLLFLVYTRLLACPLSFQPLKAFQAANKRQVPTTTKGLSAAFE